VPGGPPALADNLRDIAVRAEQASRVNRLQQVLRDLGVHRRHAGDVEHRVVRPGRDQRLEPASLDGLRAADNPDDR